MARKPLKPLSRRWMLASLAVLSILSAAPAKAAGVQFATFSQTVGTPFNFVNNATFGALSFSVAAQTKFNFTAATGLDISDRDATIVMSGSTNAAATNAGGFLIQPINGAVNSISIIENSTGKNLLTMTFTGAITGQSGSSNASLGGDTASGNTVVYSSDYLSFSGTPASYLISLPTVTPALSITGNFLTSFVSNAQGSFSGTISAVPAPTSAALFGTGMVATAVLSRRRRKRMAQANVS